MYVCMYGPLSKRIYFIISNMYVYTYIHMYFIILNVIVRPCEWSFIQSHLSHCKFRFCGWRHRVRARAKRRRDLFPYFRLFLLELVTYMRTHIPERTTLIAIKILKIYNRILCTGMYVTVDQTRKMTGALGVKNFFANIFICSQITPETFQYCTCR